MEYWKMFQIDNIFILKNLLEFEKRWKIGESLVDVNSNVTSKWTEEK